MGLHRVGDKGDFRRADPIGLARRRLPLSHSAEDAGRRNNTYSAVFQATRWCSAWRRGCPGTAWTDPAHSRAVSSVRVLAGGARINLTLRRVT